MQRFLPQSIFSVFSLPKVLFNLFKVLCGSFFQNKIFSNLFKYCFRILFLVSHFLVVFFCASLTVILLHQPYNKKITTATINIPRAALLIILVVFAYFLSFFHLHLILRLKIHGQALHFGLFSIKRPLFLRAQPAIAVEMLVLQFE